MNIRTLALIMIVIIISFLGFLVESIFTAYSNGIITNRNMILPFLLGYGLAVLSIYLIFGTPNDPQFLQNHLSITSKLGKTAYYFAVSFLCVSVGEIILGYLTQWCCGIIWWDYSAIPLHITRYTSIPTSFIFATLITVFMKYCFNPLLNAFMKMQFRSLAILSIPLLVLLSIDFIHSGIYMFKNHDLLRLWSFEFKKSIKEFIAELL